MKFRSFIYTYNKMFSINLKSKKNKDINIAAYILT